MTTNGRAHQRLWHSHPIVGALILLFALADITSTPAAYAGAITVNSTLDTSGNQSICTLRDAITAANSHKAAGGCPAGAAGGNSISFDLGCHGQPSVCTIILNGPLPVITTPLSIDGGEDFASISGNDAWRVFEIRAPGSAVRLSRLQVSHGHTSVGAAVLMVNSFSPGVTLSNDIFSDNRASSSGGAIGSYGTTLNVTNSTFSGNNGGYGGAIRENSYVRNENYHFLLTVSASSFVSNSAYIGGALAINKPAFLANVTLSENTAVEAGAIYLFDGNCSDPMTLNNATITNNHGSHTNGGPFGSACAPLDVQNSIIAGNTNDPFTTGADCTATLFSLGHNLIGDGDGCTGFSNGVNGDKVGTRANPLNPLLGSLAFNGGPTQTRALLPGSPALDAGSPLKPGSSSDACEIADQRGVTRPVGPRCDMGAYEGEQAPPAQVPEGDTLLLTASGLSGLAGYMWLSRRRRGAEKPMAARSRPPAIVAKRLS